MARRGQRVDQWRPEDTSKDAHETDSTKPARERGRSPAPPARRGRESEAVKSGTSRKRSPPLHQRPRSRSRSRDRSREHKRRRRRSRSASISRDNDRYRPSRPRDSARDKTSASPPRRRISPEANRPHRKGSRPPLGRAPSPQRARRSRSRDAAPDTRRKPRDGDRSPRVPRESHYNSNRRSPPRRRSPDQYIPTSRRRSRSPLASSYRPSQRRESSRTRSRERHSRRDTSPRHSLTRKSHTKKASRSPHESSRLRRRSPAAVEKSIETRLTSEKSSRPNKTSRRSATPPLRRTTPQTSSRSERREKSRRERSPEDLISSRRKRKHSRGGSVNGDGDMRGSYHDYGAGRGSSRPPRPHLDTGYSQTPPYPPSQISPHAQSPYARSPWVPPPPPPPGYASHHGSPLHAYPPAPSPYRAGSYPPAPSPGYFPPPPPQPPYYGASPAYQPGYSSSQHQTSVGNHYSPPDRRHSGDSRSFVAGNPPARRGHYSNLSWTPATGSRGGVQIPPRSRTAASAKTAEEEEDPFRPAKDFRVEDQSNTEEKDSKKDSSSSHTPKQETQSEGKIKFAFKAKAPTTSISTADLTQKIREPASLTEASYSKSSRSDRKDDYYSDRRHSYEGSRRDYDPDHRRRGREYEREYEPRRTEKRLVKRTKARPTLRAEFASSDSVYYRGAGNESVVGSGTYGKVYRAIHVYTEQKVALKKIRMEGERDGFPVTAIREVKLLQSLNHDNIVKLQEVMVEKNDCYMVFEYVSHDLTGLLNHPTFQLDLSHKKHLAAQLFEGLDYLHRRGVLHRDIKAANILISSNGQLKLADFGLARFFAKRRQLDYTNRVITIWYRSPELLLGETQYGTPVDIWSAACVLVEIFTKHAIFPGDGGEINQLDKIYNVLGTPTKAEWPGIVDMAWFELLRPSERKASTFAEKYQQRLTPQAFDLLKSMFAFDPAQRPSAAQVLEHPYFHEEEPPPRRAVELNALDGDWHEFESKALRKEKERADREARRVAAKEAEARASAERKRPAEGLDTPAGPAEGSAAHSNAERVAKRPRLDDNPADADTPAAAPPPPPPPPSGMENGAVAEPASTSGPPSSVHASGPSSAVEPQPNGVDIVQNGAAMDTELDAEELLQPPPPAPEKAGSE